MLHLLTIVTQAQHECTGSCGLVLPQINAQRALHCGTTPLEWDFRLAAQAEKYAQTCPNATDPTLKSTQIGETISFHGATTPAALTESKQSWNDAVSTWYGEVTHYDFGSGTGQAGFANFAAIAWDSTALVGCAYNAHANTCDNVFPGMWNSVLVCRFTKGMFGQKPEQFMDHIRPLVSAGECLAKGQKRATQVVDSALLPNDQGMGSGEELAAVDNSTDAPARR